MSARDPLWPDHVVRLGDPVPQATALVLRPARLPDPTKIAPRQWLYGTYLLRGFVSVLVAPGGTGKSSLAMAIAAALATGRRLFDQHVFAQVNAAILNLEDPLEELDRRLAAIMLRHQIDETELEGRLFMHSGEDRRIVMAAMDDHGYQVIHPDEEALIAEIRAHNIGVIIVDPFAESHSLEENSNPHMVAAAAAWRRVARATNCAILLVHHVRKAGTGTKPGQTNDIDQARGAKALTDSARVGLLLSPMEAADGELLGIEPRDQWQYVRLDNAKSNMAPRAGSATWFRLETVDLHNGTQDYPSGDHVAAVVAWKPPSALGEQPPSALNEALDVIAAGPGDGALYSRRKYGAGDRWAGTVLMRVCGWTEGQAQSVLTEWLKNGLLQEREYKDAGRRKTVTGVVVDNKKRPTV